MKFIKAKLISVAALLAFGAYATAALAQTPAHTPANNTRHAQEAGGGQGTHGARSPEKNQANNAYKQAIKNGHTSANKPQKPQKPKRPQKAQ
jgi:Spy/CpxP family protein refolding chaperone